MQPTRRSVVALLLGAPVLKALPAPESEQYLPIKLPPLSAPAVDEPFVAYLKKQKSVFRVRAKGIFGPCTVTEISCVHRNAPIDELTEVVVQRVTRGGDIIFVADLLRFNFRSSTLWSSFGTASPLILHESDELQIISTRAVETTITYFQML